jgi:acyl carrier protein
VYAVGKIYLNYLKRGVSFVENAEILGGLQDIIANKLKVTADAETIQLGTNLKSDFNIDSMKLISMLVEIENRFGITVAPDEVSSEVITDVKELVKYIASKK